MTTESKMNESPDSVNCNRRATWARKWAVIGIRSGAGGVILLLLLMGVLGHKWVWMIPIKYYGYLFFLPLLPALLGVVIWTLFGRRPAGSWLTAPLADDWIMSLGMGVLVFGLLVAIAVPSFIRASKRASCSPGQYRQVDAAKDQYALENNITNNITPRWEDLTPYLKAGSRLAMEGGNDKHGNPIIIGGIHERVRVHPRTKKLLEDATGGDTFWGPYS